MSDTDKRNHRPELAAFAAASEKFECALHDNLDAFISAAETIAGNNATGGYNDLPAMTRARITSAVSNAYKARDLSRATVGQLKEIDGFLSKALRHFPAPPETTGNDHD